MDTVYVKFFVFLFWNFLLKCQISASPQLDIPGNKNFSIQNTHFQTNGHSGRSLSDLVIKREESNEIRHEPSHYDHDRSMRYGPPYTEENDQNYYKKNYNGDEDDDDKYYTQPRSPYYISDRQRINNGYKDSTVRQLYYFCFFFQLFVFLLI